MNSEKVGYFLSISDKMNDDKFMVIFYVFSSGKKRISSVFSPFNRSLSFGRLLSQLRRCLSFIGLLFFRLSSFWRIGISWIPSKIFLSLNKDISHVLMLSAIVVI